MRGREDDVYTTDAASVAWGWAELDLVGWIGGTCAEGRWLEQ